MQNKNTIKNIPQKSSLGRKSWFFLKSILLPIDGLKSIGVFLSFWVVMPSLTATFFPRAENTFRQDGVTAEMIEKLAPGKKIYVRDDTTFAGKAHAIVMDGGGIFSPLHYLARIREGTLSQGYAMTGTYTAQGITRLLKLEKSPDLPVCRVYIKRTQLDSVSDVERAAGLTPEVKKLRIIFHELRHCSEENRKMQHGIESEGDAEYHAIEMLVDTLKKPDLRKSMLHASALYLQSISKNHNAVLYIDARQQGKTPPSVQEIEAANIEFEGQFSFNELVMAAALKKTGECKKAGLQALCNAVFTRKLSPLAQRRQDLFILGVEDSIRTEVSSKKVEIKKSPMS